MRLKLALAAAAILLPGFATATQPQPELLVIQSAGPSAARYPQGTRLPASARLVLRPGDRVVVARGNFARVFRGPGNFVARDFAAPDPRTVVGGIAGAIRGPTGSGQEVVDGPLSRFIICPTDQRCPR